MEDDALSPDLSVSAGALESDARETEALDLGRAFAGFVNTVYLPRDGRDPRYAASGVTESSEVSEDKAEDRINLGDYDFVVATTAFFVGTVAGSGSTGSIADTSDTDSSLGIRRRTGDAPLSSR